MAARWRKVAAGGIAATAGAALAVHLFAGDNSDVIFRNNVILYTIFRFDNFMKFYRNLLV